MLLLKSHNQDNLASRKIILCEKFGLKKCKYNLELQYSIHLFHHNNPGVISPAFLCRLYGCVCLCKICSDVYETDVKINMTDKTVYYIHID
jgi:hypothetical protein